jgi:hypothetical protein
VALLALAGLLGSLAAAAGSAAQAPPIPPGSPIPPGFFFGPTVQASFAISYQGHRYEISSGGNYPPDTAACVVPCQISATSSSVDRMDPSGQPTREDWTLYTGGCPPPTACSLGSGRSISYTFDHRPTDAQAQLRLTVTGHDGSTDRVSFNLRVLTPRELPQPLYFDGPREVIAPTTLLTVRTSRPQLDSDWSGCGFRAPVQVVGRTGPDAGGFYHYALWIRQAPLCALTLNLTASESSGPAASDYWSVADAATADVRVVASALPAFNGFVTQLAEGSGRRQGGDPTPYYLATALTTGYATRPYTCTATLRLEWRIAEVRGQRLVKRWKALRGLPPGRCGPGASAGATRQPASQVIGSGQPSYQLIALRQDLKVRLATMQRLRRIAPIRLVYQLSIRSGQQVVYRVARTAPLRLGQPYRDPTVPPG